MVDSGDAALLKRCQEGDQTAFQAIVDQYRHRLYAVAYGVLRNREDALDAVQETFIKMYRSLDSFKNESALFTWLYRICLNSAIDLQRKRARRPSMEFDEAIGHDPDDISDTTVVPNTESPHQSLANKELGQRIAEAIDQLPEAQRQAVILREIEGLSYQEIADVLECSVGTVMSRLHYGRKRLQEKLTAYLSA